MGHKPKFLIQLLALVSTLVLVACNGAEDKLFLKNIGDPDLFEGDVPLDQAPNNVDIVVGQSEEILHNTLLASVFAQQNLPIFEHWDSNNLVASTSESNVYESDCVSGGSIRLESSHLPGSPYQVGESFTLGYSDCVLSDGTKYNGSYQARYIEVEGLNDKFEAIDSEYCVSQLIKENPEHETTVYFNGDELRYRPMGDTVELQFVDLFDNEDEPSVVKGTQSVPANSFTIIVQQPNDVNTTEVTSLGGDRVFTLDDITLTEKRCQSYSRGVVATFDQLTVEQGSLTTRIEGAVELYEATRNFETRLLSIRDSSFAIILEEGSSSERFVFNDATLDQTINKNLDSYSFTMEGTISSDSYVYIDDDGKASGGNTILPTIYIPLSGKLNDPPTEGNFALFGSGVERIQVFPGVSDVDIEVDYDGVEHIQGRGQTDFNFKTDWSDLFNRNYLYADFDPE